MPDRRTAIRLAVLAVTAVSLLALPAVTAMLDEPFYLDLAGRVLIFAIAAVGLDLILGYGGMVCFGQAAFVGVGAYVVGILSRHASDGEPLLLGPMALAGTHSALIAWPAAMAAAAAAAFLIGLVSLRTSGVYFIMITLAFAQMIYFLCTGLESYGGSDGFGMWRRSDLGDLVDLGDSTQFYYVVLALLLTVLFFGRRLVGSRFGMVVRGARENERRMAALGFPVYRYRLACFTLAGAVAGLAGALLANQAEYVSPAYMHWTRSGELIVMVVLGGMGTLFGPIFGAAALLLLEEVLSDYTRHWMVVLGPLLVLIVLFARRGLFGWLGADRHDARGEDAGGDDPR